MQTDPLFHKRGLSWYVIVAAVFLLRSFLWFNAELWYDEVLTLSRFVFNSHDGSLLNVFRDYPIANNHMLSTAVYWIWTHLVGLPDEAILRIPSIVGGLATIATSCAIGGNSSATASPPSAASCSPSAPSSRPTPIKSAAIR